ncbi:hypothetical protein MTR67_048257 [Solanum verrucosum]|uniref:Uncharacterized protein n=1 Tax=Solanum verrucosum TaxID=315347 RepID=A0AAF0ZWA9_SOLVR|nr:hypothetical protein MTR67_048257 [Solanum verrucosum]
MKKSIAQFVAKCPNCQQVKVEYQRTGGMAHENRMTKSSHFLPIEVRNSLHNFGSLSRKVWVPRVLEVTTISLLRVISFEDEYSQGEDIVTPRLRKRVFKRVQEEENRRKEEMFKAFVKIREICRGITPNRGLGQRAPDAPERLGQRAPDAPEGLGRRPSSAPF